MVGRGGVEAGEVDHAHNISVLLSVVEPKARGVARGGREPPVATPPVGGPRARGRAVLVVAVGGRGFRARGPPVVVRRAVAVAGPALGRRGGLLPGGLVVVVPRGVGRGAPSTPGRGVVGVHDVLVAAMLGWKKRNLFERLEAKFFNSQLLDTVLQGKLFNPVCSGPRPCRIIERQYRFHSGS